MEDQLLLFTECVNLNSENCEYAKKPEEILSLFSDPDNFLSNSDKIQELNNQCFECAWFEKK